MGTKLIQTRWDRFSKSFVRFHSLPSGCELRLYDSQGRKKRADLLVKRKRVNGKYLDRATDSTNVTELISQAISLLSTDVRARGLRIGLHAPDGTRINGNTFIRTVRDMNPKTSALVHEQASLEEHQIEEIQELAHTALLDAEDLVDEPSRVVCAGFVRALEQRYSARAVRAAFEA